MHPLDNPIWNALTTRQETFAQIHGPARKFSAEVTTLAGFADPSRESLEALEQMLKPDEVVALFLQDRVPLPDGLSCIHELPLVQMLHTGEIPGAPPQQFIELTESDVPEMVALAKITNPGPFGTRTRELGNYIGVRQDAELAAMAGERLKLPGYTEVSAVCTHPRHTGHGFATALVAELVRRISARGERPFLHSRQDNTRAIEVYRRLGFTERKVFHLMVVGKAK
jgi:ribosomal protein S18 acetylase RimI-like enzyme